MKKFLVLLLMVFIAPMGVFAGEEKGSSEAPEFGEVQSYDFDFQAKADGSKIYTEWNAFSADMDMKWYKIVYSSENENPTYPEDDAHFVGYHPDKTSEVFWLKSGRMYYVRLCAITHDNDRYCSEVKKVELTSKSEAYKEKKKEHVEKKKEQYGDKIKAEKVKKVPVKKILDNKKKTATKGLTDSMKQRVDTALEKFITRLESRDYSEEKMVEVLEKVMDRLEALKSNKKYTALVEYMMEVLQEYIDEYSDSFSEIEEILNDF